MNVEKRRSLSLDAVPTKESNVAIKNSSNLDEGDSPWMISSLNVVKGDSTMKRNLELKMEIMTTKVIK
jgi:hypothetical protein